MRARIFLSWCHQDKALKEALLRDLLPALGVFTDLDVEWWQDSHLTCGEELTAGIVGRLDEADFRPAPAEHPLLRPAVHPAARAAAVRGSARRQGVAAGRVEPAACIGS